MKESEFWERMTAALGSGYVKVWADQQQLAGLGGRTVSEALADGWSCKQIWRAVATVLELPSRDS